LSDQWRLTATRRWFWQADTDKVKEATWGCQSKIGYKVILWIASPLRQVDQVSSGL